MDGIFAGGDETDILDKNAAIVEVVAADFEKFSGGQCSGAGGPGIKCIGGDDIEFVPGGEKIVTRVINDEAHPAFDEIVRCITTDDAVVFAVEILGGDRGDLGLDLADGDFVDVTVKDEGAGGDAGAAAQDENGFRFLVKKGGVVAEHELEAHGFGGS